MTTLEFKVMAPVHINHPNLRNPLFQSRYELAGCFCLASTIGFEARLTHTDFIVGDSIPLVVDVTNGSSHRIKLQVSFIKIEQTQRIIRAHYETYDRNARRTIETFTSPEIAPHTTEHTWNAAEYLTVPSTLEPSLSDCEYVQRHHVLKIAVLLPWPQTKKARVEIPVRIIGSAQLTRLYTS